MKEVEGVKPLVCIPLERAISYADEVVPWLVGLGQQGWVFGFRGYGRTDVTRNEFVKHLLGKTDCTHLVMLDLDHAHPPDVVWRLCKRAAEDRTRRVISALAYRRGAPFEPIAFRWDEKIGKFFAVLDGNGLVEVDRLGFGAVIIARDVFEEIGWPYFSYVYETGEDGERYPTEDMWFSRRCQEQGIRLWVDFDLVTDHLTVSRVNGLVFESYLRSQEGEKQEVGDGRE